MQKFIFLSVLILIISGCAGRRPSIDIPATQPPPPALKKSPRVVVVLGSGGARGYAHLGVLQALLAAHIPIDGIVCASAGCMIGALYADTLNIDKAYKAMMSAGFWDFADISNLPKASGLMTGYHLEKFLLKQLDAHSFNQLKIPLVVATTDLQSGRSYLIRGGPVAPAVLASATLPGMVQPAHLYGRILIDGGVAAPVPVKFAQVLHPKVVIAVNIAQALTPQIPLAAYSIYERAYKIMWLHLTDSSELGADIIIHPYLGDVGTFDMSHRYQMYLAGLRAGKKMVPAIKRVLIDKQIALH